MKKQWQTVLTVIAIILSTIETLWKWLAFDLCYNQNHYQNSKFTKRVHRQPGHRTKNERRTCINFTAEHKLYKLIHVIFWCRFNMKTSWECNICLLDPEIDQVAAIDRFAIGQFWLDSIDRHVSFSITMIQRSTRLGRISIDRLDRFWGLMSICQTKQPEDVSNMSCKTFHLMPALTAGCYYTYIPITCPQCTFIVTQIPLKGHFHYRKHMLWFLVVCYFLF